MNNRALDVLMFFVVVIVALLAIVGLLSLFHIGSAPMDCSICVCKAVAP